MFGIEKIEIYQTSDGKTFDTYGEAEMHCYEIMSKDFEGEVDFFNRDGEILEAKQALPNYDSIFFFIARTNKGVELLCSYLNKIHVDFPEIEVGEMYRYDTTDDYWVSAKEDIQNFNSLWKGLFEAHS